MLPRTIALGRTIRLYTSIPPFRNCSLPLHESATRSLARRSLTTSLPRWRSSESTNTDADKILSRSEGLSEAKNQQISTQTQRDGEDRFSSAASEELLQSPASSRQPIGRIDRRLNITFTCTVPNCGKRSSHEFSRHAYEHGIVLVQCPGCDWRHLIADHLGWFDSDDLTQGGKYKTIEALLASKGEAVARARVLMDGTIEVDTPDGEESK